MFHYNENYVIIFFPKNHFPDKVFTKKKKNYFLLPNYEEDIQFNFSLLRTFLKLTNYLKRFKT